MTFLHQCTISKSNSRFYLRAYNLSRHRFFDSDNYVSYGLHHVEWTLGQNGKWLVTSVVSVPLLHQWGYLAKKAITVAFSSQVAKNGWLIFSSSSVHSNPSIIFIVLSSRDKIPGQCHLGFSILSLKYTMYTMSLAIGPYCQVLKGT